MHGQQFPACFSLILIVITGCEEFVIIASGSELNYVAISMGIVSASRATKLSL